MHAIKGLNHVNLYSSDPHKTVAFYGRLGFKAGYRPNAFADPGVWLYAGDDDYQILHVNVLPPERFAALGEGPFGHVGLGVRGTIAEVTGWLKSLNIEYDLWDPIPGAHRALYFKGPSNEVVELVFVDEPIEPVARR